MALLRNNNVYIFDISSVKAWYHSYNQHVIQPLLGDITINTSFNEDMRILIMRMNGIISLDKFNSYINDVSMVVEAVTERHVLMDTMWDMIQNMCCKVFPEYPGAPSDDIFFHFDETSIYILDRRRMTYVPSGICHSISSAGGEPLLNDDAWV